MLTDHQILKYIELKKIVIDPFTRKNLGPVSYDLSISDTVRHINFSSSFKLPFTIDASIPTTFGELKKLPITLKSGDVVVFTTEEKIFVDNDISGIVHARSSLTKLPLLFNIAGLVDPGFLGSLTGVMYNLNPKNILIEKMRICQITFVKHDKVDVSYNTRNLSKNQNQYGENALSPKTDKEFQTR